MEPLDETQKAAQAQFSKQSRSYGKGHILENVDDVRQALSPVHLPAPAQVLDVACGAGHTGLYLASLGHAVTLADLSGSMLERVCEAALERGLMVETRQHPAESMPYEDGIFDLVTCRVAPHHFSSPADFVLEVARVLRPGGWFMLIDGTVPDDLPEAGKWLNTLEKWRDPSHVRLLPPQEWIDLCTRAGLKIQEWAVHQKKQPDLEWYFAAAATPEPNRLKVHRMIETSPQIVRDTFELQSDNGKIVWQWPMLSLLARKD